MSKRCELQKEYYKEFGNYKGDGKYSDHYVNWLESRILALTIPVVSNCTTCNSEINYKGVCEMCYTEPIYGVMPSACNFYVSGNDTSMDCNNCGKPHHMH
jgi:hypothetical protein